MNKYTVILGYLDNSSDYSFEHVEAIDPKEAMEKAKRGKYIGDDPSIPEEEVTEAIKGYPVYGCIVGHHIDANWGIA